MDLEILHRYRTYTWKNRMPDLQRTDLPNYVNHWKVLSLVRKLSHTVPITWVCGNHDGPAEVISHLSDVPVIDPHTVKSGGQRVLVLHGHQFDDFIESHPRITWLADLVYRLLQYIDRTHRIARFANTDDKVFLRCAEKVIPGATSRARQSPVSGVCCGHTHHAEFVEGDHQYTNSGSWTEHPCTDRSTSGGAIRPHPLVEAASSESTTSLKEHGEHLPEYAQ